MAGSTRPVAEGGKALRPGITTPSYGFPVPRITLPVVGLTCGAVVFVLTAFHVIAQPDDGLNVGLLSQYFFGFDVTWRGAFIGFWWAFVAGFSGAWFVAFLRNLSMAIWIFVIRTKAELRQTSDFLDHI